MTNETNEEVPYINNVFSSDYIPPLLPSPPIGTESILFSPTRSSSISWHSLWNNSDSIWKVEQEESAAVRQRSNSMIPYTTAAALDDYFQPRKNTRRYSLVPPTSSWPSEEDYYREEVYRPPTPPFQEPVVINPSSIDVNIQHLGKGILIHQVKFNEIYQVLFKSNRIDYFYYVDNDKIQIDDYVIVEGDRGYDLGKVMAILEKKKTTEKHIKQLFCKANEQELTNYQTKQKEEEKALAICQWKIKQKELPMEVVDAEYQWDRRKLTFYFHATQRIDFRELVRELFKIYKTRIWMSCAAA